MADDVVIRAEGLGKKYVIGHAAEREHYVVLRDVIARNTRSFGRAAMDLLRGRPMVAGDELEEFWALKEVSFEVKRGEVLGVIGRNGAGKSTLLKILSRITEPSEGRVTIHGRVASLLEVGTGFHPELTGRENVYLNGAILGMSHAEIRRRFDEIVAFAEVERFLDTPVKRYSSGMYVRLAFAVAAHLEPEILVVDEVLAVGDAEFQKKCLGRMGEVSKEGRTVLFVSHNIGALSGVCDSGLLLKAGNVAFRGSIDATARAYRELTAQASMVLADEEFQGALDSVKFADARVNGRQLSTHQRVSSDDNIEINVSGIAAGKISDFRVTLALACEGRRILTIHDGPETLMPGLFETVFQLPAHLLRPGEYWLSIGGGKARSAHEWTAVENIACIEIVPRWAPEYDRDAQGIINVPKGASRIQNGAELGGPTTSRTTASICPDSC